MVKMGPLLPGGRLKVCNYYVTFNSNDMCEFCGIWQRDELKDAAENPYDLKNLLPLGVGEVNIIGGEPLLREDLPLILETARGLGFKVNLNTNGILYAEKAKSISSLVDRLFISLDYPIAELHDRSRGVECFHQVIKSIELARDLQREPIIKFTMTRDSVVYLPEMIDLAERLKVRVYLIPVYDFYGTQGFEKRTFSYIRYYAAKKNVLMNYAALDFVKDGGNKVLFPRCRAKETTVTVLPDGKMVSPCFFNPGGRQGREDICSSCARWPYMLPSFSSGVDKYRWLDQFSKFKAWRRGIKI